MGFWCKYNTLPVYSEQRRLEPVSSFIISDGWLRHTWHIDGVILFVALQVNDTLNDIHWINFFFLIFRASFESVPRMTCPPSVLFSVTDCILSGVQQRAAHSLCSTASAQTLGSIGDNWEAAFTVMLPIYLWFETNPSRAFPPVGHMPFPFLLEISLFFLFCTSRDNKDKVTVAS